MRKIAGKTPMQSITRPQLQPAQVHSAIRRHLGALPARVEEIMDGWFSAIFRIEMPDGGKFMLKAAPPKQVRLLRYEAHAMTTEVQVTQLIRRESAVPVPEIIAHDVSLEILPCDYFLMTALPGAALNRLRDKMDAPTQERIDRQVGRDLKELHSIHGQGFGRFGGPLYPSMPEAFSAMVSDLESDAADFEVEGVAQGLAVAKRHADTLAEATTSSLVHWDLNDGNIIVDPNTNEITGYIDFERALWADPLVEYNFLWPLPAFLEGYAQDFSNLAARRKLYELYLGLIFVIECYSRKFSAEHEAWARKKLAEALDNFP